MGKPHGIDGAFVVEQASEEPGRFALGAKLLAGGEAAEVVESKRSGGRLVIRLDRAVPRGELLQIPRVELPPSPRRASSTSSSSWASTSRRREGARSGGSPTYRLGVANDVLELDSGLSLPMVEACVREVDLEGAANPGRARASRPTD